MSCACAINTGWANTQWLARVHEHARMHCTTLQGAYNTILAGAAFMDSATFFPAYFSQATAPARALVDEVTRPLPAPVLAECTVCCTQTVVAS